MDSIQDYIVIAFLIISFLSSFLKSKEKKNSKKVPIPGNQVPIEDKVSQKEKDEIGQWFRDQISKPASYENNSDSEFKSVSKINHEVSSQRVTKPKKVIQQLPKDYGNKKLNKKLSQNSSLREYIIMSEILGKPKALRDN